MKHNKTMFKLNKIFSGLLLTGAISFPVYGMDLPEAITETLSSNPEIQAQLRESDARNRQVREALGGFYPDVDLLTGFGFQERDPTSGAPAGRTRNELERSEAQLNVRQMVFDGFNTWNEYQNQKAREESAVHRVKAVAEQVSLDAVQAYMDLMKRESILRLAEQTLSFHTDIYDRMKKRFDSGVGSRADFNQISGRLALAKTNFFNAQANLIDAKTNFQRIVGTFPATGDLARPASYRNYLPATVDEAVARAVQNHPIMEVANADLKGVE
jgi:adhesin transport system outer membrane protein